jgi:glycine cleavage system aminomethyltransferase T
MANGVVPPEGGQIVVDGRPGGRVTSARWSEHLGKAIGMGWVPPALAEEDAEIAIKVDGRVEKARVRLRPFFDPDGERLRT